MINDATLQCLRFPDPSTVNSLSFEEENNVWYLFVLTSSVVFLA